MHTGWLVVGCWFLVWVWIYSFSIPSFPVHTEHSQWVGALLGTAGFESEPLQRQGDAEFVILAPGEPGCVQQGVAGLLLGKGQLHLSPHFTAFLWIIEELKGI